jgi:hypothetical protein
VYISCFVCAFLNVLRRYLGHITGSYNNNNKESNDSKAQLEMLSEDVVWSLLNTRSVKRLKNKNYKNE